MSDLKSSLYKTSDTALAAYLITQGHYPLHIDYEQPRFEYSFENNNIELAQHASKYVTGNALVDPATYNRVFRKLSRIVRSKIQWQDEL
jgi:hypothetical protein